MIIRTNNHSRDLVNGWQVPADVQAEFDYIDWIKVAEGSESVSFFRYLGVWYDLGEFQRIDSVMVLHNSNLSGWDGYSSDTVFSGLLVRWAKDWAGELDTEGIVVGAFYL